MNKVFKYVFADILQNRIILIYTSVLLIATYSIFNLEDTSSKGLLSMLNVTLMMVPLVSIVFSTIYIYNSSEFIELLLSQPVQRKNIWLGLYTGLSTAFGLSYLLGAGIITLIFEPSITGCILVISGILLSYIFTALAFLAAVYTRDKARGIGVAIMLWIYFSVLFDGLVLFALFQFADYPIEKPMIAVSLLNPIDLTRIFMLMQLDVAAMMGYTGAIFKDFFSTNIGWIVSFTTLLLWILLPLFFSLNKFKRKDI